MSSITSRQRVRGLVGTAVAAMVVMSCPTAVAGQYTVASCDSAAAYGHNTTAWVPFANAGTAYEACPTNGGPTAGVSNRLTQGTYGGFSYSGHAFTAPPGATITRLRWAGRMSRANCQLGRLLPRTPKRRAASWECHTASPATTLGFDNRGWPIPESVPAGTTRLEQLVFCGAAECPAVRRLPHPRDRSDGRRPGPAKDLTERPAGERAVGERDGGRRTSSTFG